jgi:hypothetical protein
MTAKEAPFCIPIAKDMRNDRRRTVGLFTLGSSQVDPMTTVANSATNWHKYNLKPTSHFVSVFLKFKFIATIVMYPDPNPMPNIAKPLAANPAWLRYIS